MHIPASDIHELICVSKPYYALQNLTKTASNSLLCEIEVENTSSGESSAISIAEAGRHLAILGSCALAFVNPVKTKHYYLAYKASINGVPGIRNILKQKPGIESKLIAQADVITFDQGTRTGSANTWLLAENGDTVFTMTVTYQVLPENIFRKLFKKYYTEVRSNNEINPYTKLADLENINFSGSRLSGNIAAVTPRQCFGHFDNFPALPVATLSGLMARACAIHMQKFLQNENLRYVAKKAAISAFQLAFSGTEVHFNTFHIQGSPPEYTFLAKASTKDGAAIGEFEITFEVL